MRRLILILMMLAAASISMAQRINIDPELERQIEAKVNKFTSNVSNIADKGIQYSERLAIIDATKKFFYGNCEQVMLNGSSDIAKMTVSYTANNVPRFRSYPMKNYFTNLASLRYSKVVIKNVGRMFVTDAVKEDGHIKFTVQYAQAFMGVRPDGGKYIDYQEKSIVVIMTELPDGYKFQLWHCNCEGQPAALTEQQFNNY